MIIEAHIWNCCFVLSGVDTKTKRAIVVPPGANRGPVNPPREIQKIIIQFVINKLKNPARQDWLYYQQLNYLFQI